METVDMATIMARKKQDKHFKLEERENDVSDK
jgi:hypothetical protein